MSKLPNGMDLLEVNAAFECRCENTDCRHCMYINPYIPDDYDTYTKCEFQFMYDLIQDKPVLEKLDFKE